MNETTTIQCVEKDCGTFEFESGEREFYASKGFPPPKRCKAHRLAKRERMNQEASPLHPDNWRNKEKDIRDRAHNDFGDKEAFNP